MAPLVWLITGTSSGLGNHLARAVIARGDICIATSRNTSALTTLQSLGAHVLPLDVTSPYASIQSTIAAAVALHGRIDVLVNNAGFITIGAIEELDEADWERQFATNVFGAVKVARAVLPYMRERRDGVVVWLSSLSGWIGHMGCGAYAGSKFAVEGIAESLHQETAPLGIRSLLIEPGRFRTTFLSPGNMQSAPTATIPDYAASMGAMRQYLAQEDMQQPGNPEKFADVVVDLVRGEGVASGKTVPFRVQLGKDCVEDVRGKCEEVIKQINEWEEVGISCGFE